MEMLDQDGQYSSRAQWIEIETASCALTTLSKHLIKHAILQFFKDMDETKRNCYVKITMFLYK